MSGGTMAAAAPFALASRTPATWAPSAARDLQALLSDHAHCELKAAASAMTLLKRQAARPGLALRLAPLIREEAEHLQRVLCELAGRGWPLLPDGPSPYMRGLLAAAGAPRRREEGYVDGLLVSALIEQRSHERFERLLECPALAELEPLYRPLAEAEARHGALFVDLACEAVPCEVAARRHAELAAAEAALIAGLPAGPRIHSGPPAGAPIPAAAAPDPRG
jgi:tRNA 2-(methylsulfanyl)-N6-isopentenyladenosine37 hydroxylase